MDKKIIDILGNLLPMLSEEEKERLLAYIEGMAFMADRRATQSNTEGSN
jgi:hypothetical protein